MRRIAIITSLLVLLLAACSATGGDVGTEDNTVTENPVPAFENPNGEEGGVFSDVSEADEVPETFTGENISELEEDFVTLDIDAPLENGVYETSFGPLAYDDTIVGLENVNGEPFLGTIYGQTSICDNIEDIMTELQIEGNPDQVQTFCNDDVIITE